MAGPVVKKKYKNLSVAVFDKTSADNKQYYSICVQRSFKKQDGSYDREIINLFRDDLLTLAELLTKTFDALLDKDEEKQEQAPKVDYPENITNDDTTIPF